MTAAIKQQVMLAIPEFERDDELAARCSAGDEKAMQMLYERHSKRLYLLAYRLTDSGADAEEVVQESFLKAWRNIAGFRGDSSMGTWLYRIALNLCRDRAKKSRPINEEREVGVHPKQPDTFMRQRLKRALTSLSDGYREVLVMHDVMEMKHLQIAEILGIAVGTSKSQLHKARAQMRGLLKECGVATANS